MASAAMADGQAYEAHRGWLSEIAGTSYFTFRAKTLLKRLTTTAQAKSRQLVAINWRIHCDGSEACRSVLTRACWRHERLGLNLESDQPIFAGPNVADTF